MLTTVKSFIPLSLRIRLRTRYERSRKSLSRIMRPYDPLMPPDELMFVGGDRTNFKQMGEKWRETLIQFGGLQPHHRVLDAGCGVGRIALALTGYLTPPGLYDGSTPCPRALNGASAKLRRASPTFAFDTLTFTTSTTTPAAASPLRSISSRTRTTHSILCFSPRSLRTCFRPT